MNWRQFKTDPEGFKGFEGFKPPEPLPLKPLRHLKPGNGILEKSPLVIEAELFDMIRETVEELNASGSWEGFRQGVAPEARQSIKAIEVRIDSTYRERNRQGLTAALQEYWGACLQARNDLPERKNQR